jgi:signal transduction histidine kinase
MARIMVAAARNLNALIDRSMVMSALRSGAMVLSPAPTPLANVVDTAMGNVAADAAAREVTLARCFEDAPVLSLDGRFGELVVEALLANAVRHSAATARVEVDVIESDDVVKLVVRDHGAGMPLDEVARVVRAFEVLDLDHHGRGHGLGLPIAKAMVEAHRGTLRLESEPGNGTIVTVELPRATVPSTPAATDGEPARRRRPVEN